jgi:hypothetical protein
VSSCISKSFLLKGFTEKHTSNIVFCTFQWVLLSEKHAIKVLLSEKHAIKELLNGIQEAQSLILS